MARRRAARRRSRRGRSSNWPWWLLIGLVVLAVSGFGLFYFKVSGKGQVDEATLCPKSGPTAMLVILLDLSDPLHERHATRLRREIDRHIGRAGQGTMISVAVVGADQTKSSIGFGLCKPLQGDEASRIYQNSTLVERRYETGFNRPLSEAVDSMLRGEEMNTSPIIETMHNAVVDSVGFGKDGINKNLVLVSDLYQNSGVFSFYRGEGWNAFARSPGFDRVTDYLDGFNVHVIRIQRRVPDRSSNIQVEDFWVRYFEKAGAESVQPDSTTLGGF